MDKDEIMEEINEAQKEKLLQREISQLKEKPMKTGKEPRRKRIKLKEICEEIRMESYATWKRRKIREERRMKERDRIER